MKRLTITLLVAVLTGCAETPPKYSRFLNTDYTEIQADRDRVAMAWLEHESDMCGFVNFNTKKVWLARDIRCDMEVIRRHELCHIQAREAGNTDGKDGCHDKSFYKD